MTLPTAASVSAASLVDFESLGFDEPKLTRIVAVAVSLLGRYTDQRWDVGGIFAPVPPMAALDEPLVEDAIVSLVEWMAYRKQADTVETLGDFDLLTSFSAGSYSESRRSGKDSEEANRAVLRKLLWPIMSPDKQDEWLMIENGTNLPAFAVTEVNWGGRSEGAPYDRLAGAPYPTAEEWDPYYDPRLNRY